MTTLVLDRRETRTMVLAAGLAAGMLGVFLLAVPTKWMVAAIAGLIVLCVGVLQPDIRRYTQVLFVLSLPLATFNHQFFARADYFGTPGVAFGLVEVLLIALYGLWLLSGPSWPRVRAVFVSRASLAALALLAVAAASVFVADDRELAVFGVIALAKAYLVFFYVACMVDRRRLTTVVDVLLAAVLVQQLLAIVQYVTHSSLGLAAFGESAELMQMTFGGSTFVRVAATLVHPNQFANFMGLVLPIALALLIAGRRSGLRNLFYATVFLLGMAVFVLTFSRTGWIHLITSSVVVLAFTMRRVRIRRELVNVAIVGAIVVAIFLLVFSSAIYARLFESSPVLVTARFDMAQVALGMWRARPVLGVGINNYVNVLPVYDHIGVMEAPVHNLYLLLAAEVGALGLGAFLLMVAFVLGRVRAALSSADPVVAAVAAGLAGGFAGFLVDGISDFSYVLASTNLLFWFLAGLAVALSFMAKEDGEGPCAS